MLTKQINKFVYPSATGLLTIYTNRFAIECALARPVCKVSATTNRPFTEVLTPNALLKQGIVGSKTRHPLALSCSEITHSKMIDRPDVTIPASVPPTSTRHITERIGLHVIALQRRAMA